VNDSNTGAGCTDHAGWRRSTACTGGSCVEVQASGGMVYIRSSVDPEAEIRFTPQEWLAFTVGARLGEFDVETL
jgi:hypothetical protein